jgi:hypothetical protein
VPEEEFEAEVADPAALRTATRILVAHDAREVPCGRRSACRRRRLVALEPPRGSANKPRCLTKAVSLRSNFTM